MHGLNNLLKNAGGTSRPSSMKPLVRQQKQDLLLNKFLMGRARASLSGNWGMAFFGLISLGALFLSIALFFVNVFVFFGLLSPSDIFEGQTRCIDNCIIIASLFLFLFNGAFQVSFCRYFLAFTQHGEGHLEYIFKGFKRFFIVFFTSFFIHLFLFLWSIFSTLLLGGTLYYIKDKENSVFITPFILVLLLPAIVAAYRYSMSFFVLADDPDCGVFEAIARSKEMMKGKKLKLFHLQWRFFWWHVLALCTLGIGYFWLIPYIKTSFSEFYENVK